MNLPLVLTGTIMALVATVVRFTLSDYLTRQRARHDPSAWRLSVFMWGLPIYIVIALLGLFVGGS
jgi:hypothetical protein